LPAFRFKTIGMYGLEGEYLWTAKVQAVPTRKCRAIEVFIEYILYVEFRGFLCVR
jgi:hypothetical protein